MQQQTSIHGMWSSRLAFILAASGSAVGLGNIWRFPYLTSDNGGGAFVLIYLACIALVGLPIMAAEILLGRQGRLSPINTLRKITSEGGHSRFWVVIGWIGLASAVMILSFYSVIGGWTLNYAFDYLLQLLGMAPAITDPGATFGAMLASPGSLVLWHTVFMLLTVGVVALGVEKGLERAVTWLMPLLFLILLGLLGYGVSTGKVGQAFEFLFVPDWSEVKGSTVLAALGQAFFSLSLGMCGIMTYGAYLPQGISIPRVSITVALTDTSVALLAGLAIFPVVFAFGIDPAGGGPGLIFTALPLAFNDMPFGIAYAVAFFVLLAVAAWTSSISLLEPPTAFLVEKCKLTRGKAAMVSAVAIWALGLVTALSFNVWQQVRVMGRDLQGAIEYLASDLMLPIGGLLIAVFTGWFLSRDTSRGELSHLSDGAFAGWLWLVRVVAPALVLLVLARAFL
ncbi:MAG TPA: sodium-dependent transporter [Arenimonas sp.]|nr:sodium-dependent transporter [Arenimonas sp.]